MSSRTAYICKTSIEITAFVLKKETVTFAACISRYCFCWSNLYSYCFSLYNYYYGRFIVEINDKGIDKLVSES